AARANDALGKLDRDLRAGGFGANSRGLARDLYASFTATIIGVRGTEDEAIAWAIGRALAVDLEAAGGRRGALALLDGLIAFAGSHADRRILVQLMATEEAIDRKAGARRRAVGQGQAPERAAAGPAHHTAHPSETVHREPSFTRPSGVSSERDRQPVRTREPEPSERSHWHFARADEEQASAAAAEPESIPTAVEATSGAERVQRSVPSREISRPS